MSQWVFLRGLGREARHWGNFPALFAQTVHAEKITLQDFAGNGVFNLQRSAKSVGSMVEFARAHLMASSIKPPYQLLAMSLGAMVASQWALRYPKDINRLVLINTSMRPFSHTAQRLRLQNWPGLAAAGLRWRNAHFVERTVFGLTCRRLDTRSNDEAAWREIRATAPVAGINLARQLLAAACYHAEPLAPDCPVLVLSGRADALVDPICSRHVANAWAAQHRQHEWAGHDLPHDDPLWVCAQVAEWLGLDALL